MKTILTLVLVLRFCAAYSQEAKIYSSVATKAKVGNARIVNLINASDTVKVTENFLTSSVQDRRIVASGSVIDIVWNKEKKKNELYSGAGELLGETGSNQRDFFNFTPTTGKPLAVVKISKNEWRYTSAGQELVKIRKLDKKTVEITVLDGTQTDSQLAVQMSYAYASYLVDGSGVNPALIVCMVILAIMRASV